MAFSTKSAGRVTEPPQRRERFPGALFLAGGEGRAFPIADSSPTHREPLDIEGRSQFGWQDFSELALVIP
jgi:hypothetical protein